MSVFNKFRKDIFIIFLMFIRSNEWRYDQKQWEKNDFAKSNFVLDMDIDF